MKKTIKVKSLEGTPFLISEEQPLGKGSFGQVYRAYNRDQPYLPLVAKIIPMTEQNSPSITSQIQTLRQIPHSTNLVNCLKYQISSQHNFYLIMQYCNGGSFQKYISKHHNCSQELIWRFIVQFVKGYRVLYDCHVLHRDIKPENIMLNDGVFKIADFGLSRSVHHHSLKQNLSIKGTPLYIAPQLQSQAAGCSKIDVFSFGVVLYRLAFNGLHPFYRESKVFGTVDEYFEYLAATALKFPKYPSRSQQLLSLITRMLEKDPKARISWKQIFEHPRIEQKPQPAPCSEIPPQSPISLSSLQKSIIQISRSSATLQSISQPFNHQNQMLTEINRLMEFTEYLPKIEIKGLEIYLTRARLLVQLVHYLNAKIKNMGHYHHKTILGRVLFDGFRYVRFTITKMLDVLACYEGQLPTPQPLLHSLHSQLQSITQTLSSLPTWVSPPESPLSYPHLEYQNTLYDFLTSFCEMAGCEQQQLKTVASLMADLYDGLLKLQSMIFFKQNGRIELIEIQLQDAELDAIDYQNLRTYRQYLERVNEIMLPQLTNRLKSMGLIFV